MTVPKKPTAAAPQEPLDEIDQIMNEIEQLQQSMTAAPEASPQTTAIETTSPKESMEAGDSMDEFHAGGSDNSLEETLANLKDDEPSGPNLIDQAIEAEKAEKVAEPVALEVASSGDDFIDDESTELLDAAESEALDEAVEAAEAEALKIAESQEEEVMEPVRPLRRPSRPVAIVPDAQEVVPSSAQGSVALTLSGNMTLKLRYEFEGQEVTVGFSEGALRVELSDGTEFKIPVRRNSAKKVA